MKIYKIITGITSSLVIGTILGILFAPDKGSNTRKKITQKGDGLKADIKKKLGEIVSSLKKHKQSTSKKADVVDKQTEN